MALRWVCTLSTIFLLAGWVETVAGQTVTLGSGTSVEIIAVGPLQSTAGWSALALKYRTAIPLSDVQTLRREADEIWDRFVADVEHGGYQTALISATEPESGSIVTTNKSYNFVFEKKDGSWRTPESKDRVQAKLDPDFVREFVDRLDTSLEHNEMNALLLYMANDWTVTIVNPADKTSPSQTVDRMKFVAVTHATFAAASQRQHHRKLSNIFIAENGQSAQVESQETEEITVNGHQSKGVEPLY
jgi:hypothetical protein